jgi:hypothetical protein
MAKAKTRTQFSCSVALGTLEAILATAKADGLSQGEVIDKAVALLAFGEVVERAPKLSKANQRVAEVAAADITARAVDRDDVACDTDELPTQHITSVPPPQANTKIDIDNLPDVKPIGMPRAQWEMLWRKKHPVATPAWRTNTVVLGKPGVRK